MSDTETHYHAGLALGAVPLPPWLADGSAYRWRIVAQPDRRDAMAQTFRDLQRERRGFWLLTANHPPDEWTWASGRRWRIDNERGLLRWNPEDDFV